eukprot:14841490-Alexandrium_andersonii.AAC.1
MAATFSGQDMKTTRLRYGCVPNPAVPTMHARIKDNTQARSILLEARLHILFVARLLFRLDLNSSVSVLRVEVVLTLLPHALNGRKAGVLADAYLPARVP